MPFYFKHFVIDQDVKETNNFYITTYNFENMCTKAKVAPEK